MKNLLLIINPVAGRMRLRSGLLDIIKVYCKAGYNVTTQVTLRQGHGIELAAEAESKGFDQIVCCGGDGTLNECISGLVRSGSSIPVGYIPCGSTNDFANTLGLSADLTQAAYNSVYGHSFQMDIGLFNGERSFSYIASFGAFTEASYNVPQDIKNKIGHLAYVLGGIKDIAEIKSYDISVQADSFSCRDKYIFGSVSNTTSVGGIVKLNANIVDLQDGLFEVMLVKAPRNIFQLNDILSAIAFSDFEKSEMFEFHKASEVIFNMPESSVWTLDGEPFKTKPEVNIKTLPKAVSLTK